MNIRNLVPQRIRRPLRFAYLRTINTLLHGDPHYISQVTIETSTACNRRCSYCPVSIDPRKQEVISDEMINLIILRLREIRWRGPLDVIHYNEPLINPRLPLILRRLADGVPGAFLMVTTNGDKLTPDMLVSLLNCGVKQFNVTRHIPHSQEWDWNMGVLLRTWPDKIHFLNSPGEEGWSNRAGLIEIPGPNAIDGECFGPENINIMMDGKVLLCCCDYYRQTDMGNIRDQTIHEIFYGPKMSQLRKEVRKGIARLEMCQKCMANHKKP